MVLFLRENKKNQTLTDICFPTSQFIWLSKTKKIQGKVVYTKFSWIQTILLLKPVFLIKMFWKFDSWSSKYIILNFLRSKLGSLIKTGKNWLESSQNRGIVKKGLFFLWFDPWNQFYGQFWHRKVSQLYWLCLSFRYIARIALWVMQTGFSALILRAVHALG